MNSNQAIGIVGIGNMGLPMALNLLERQAPVVVRDIRPEREATAREHGARSCASPAEMAAEVSLMLLVVVDAGQVDEVLFGARGAIEALRPGSSVAVCSTVAPEDMARWGERLAERGVGFADAPISGGPARARNGSLTVMLAAAAAVAADFRLRLDGRLGRIVAVGERIGDGSRVKLVNNLLAGIHLAAAAEAFALAERLGLEPHTLYDIVCSSSGHSWILQDRIGRALQDDFAPRAEARILSKDLGLALDCASAAGMRTPLGKDALALFEAACDQGLAELDDAAVLLAARRAYRLAGGSH